MFFVYFQFFTVSIFVLKCYTPYFMSLNMIKIVFNFVLKSNNLVLKYTLNGSFVIKFILSKAKTHNFNVAESVIVRQKRLNKSMPAFSKLKHLTRGLTRNKRSWIWQLSERLARMLVFVISPIIKLYSSSLKLLWDKKATSSEQMGFSFWYTLVADDLCRACLSWIFSESTRMFAMYLLWNLAHSRLQLATYLSTNVM